MAAADFAARRRSLLRRAMTLNSRDVGARVVRGAGYQFLGIGLRTLITLGSTAILARLLVPADFGYVAMATVVTEFAALFAGFGLANLLIQRPRITRLQIDTIFWASVALGCVLAVAVWALSHVATALFSDPLVAPLLRVLAWTFALSGLPVVATVVLGRLMRFHVEFWVQISVAALRAVTAIVAAWAGLGLWSLVAGALAGSLAQALLAFWVVPYRPRLRFRLRFLQDTWRTSGSYFGNGLFYYLNMNVDLVLVGRTLGAAPLGLYQTARSLTDEIRGRIAIPIQHVLFPAFSSLQAEPDRWRSLVLRSARLLAAVVVPIGLGVSANANDLVLTLYGPRWLEMTSLMAAFGFSAALRASTAFSSSLFNAQNRVGTLLRFNAVGTLITMASVAFGLQFGLHGVAIAVALSSLYALLPCVSALRPIGMSWRDLLRMLGPAALAGMVMWGVTWSLQTAGWVAALPASLRLLTLASIGGCVYLGMLLVFSRPIRHDLQQVVGSLRSR